MLIVFNPFTYILWLLTWDDNLNNRTLDSKKKSCDMDIIINILLHQCGKTEGIVYMKKYIKKIHSQYLADSSDLNMLICPI